MVDLEGTLEKTVNAVERNATILSIIGTGWARLAENNISLSQAISNIPQEILRDFGYGNPGGPIASLKWKLWDAPHAPTQIGKYATMAWALGKLTGLIPAKYEEIAGRVAVGAYAAALLLPASNDVGTTDAPPATIRMNPSYGTGPSALVGN